MYKHQRKLLQKCKENPQLANRGSSRPRKVEGNLNITSKRLTIPPGFLCLGIKSKTIRKSKSPVNIDTQKDYIVKEDLHSLFNNNLDKNNAKLRRSSRILKKKESCDLKALSASDYYSKVLVDDCSFQSSESSKGSPCRNSRLVRNNSKSIFKEINERSARVQKQKKINLNNSVEQLSAAKTDNEEVFKPSVFCKNLLEEICFLIHDRIRDSNILLNSKLSILEGIKKINDTLSGKIIPMEELLQETYNKKINSDVNHDELLKTFNYLPKCEWVFETPPRQGITLPKVRECGIEPAIICTSKKQSNIYQVNSNINMDFSNYNSMQNVEVDERYFNHMASFTEKTPFFSNFNQDVPMQCTTTEFNYFQCKTMQPEQKFDFKMPFPTEHPFMETISRPTKAPQRTSRVENLLKRKLSDLSPDKKDIHDHGNINFQFKKNLFKDVGDEDGFGFNKEESKLFDFSLYKND